MKIETIPLLRDNYTFLIHDEESGETAVVDPAEAEPVKARLQALGWRLTHILNTHHHGDHVGGNPALKAVTGATVFGASSASEPIPGLDRAIGQGDRIDLGRHRIEVLAVPGHTRNHLAFWLPGEPPALFCGDTLFAMGCGRLLGGTVEQLWGSLEQLRRLPGESRLYCAHEYTEQNGRFALGVEPGNRALQERQRQVRIVRSEGRPTIPSRMQEEWATNPFLRLESPEIRASLAMEEAPVLAVFAELRRRKDLF